MKTFEYSLLPKIIYKYANIPITILLGFYLFISTVTFSNNYMSYFAIFVHLLLIFIVNRYYFRNYKLMPYKIEADNEKMICTQFSFQNKISEIKFDQITEITGGIFEGSKSRPIIIRTNGNEKITINIHINNFNSLLTIILANINKELYVKLLDRIKKISEDEEKSPGNAGTK